MARRPRGLPAGLRLESSTRKDPATRADPVTRADLGRADPGRADTSRADLAPADPRADTVARADPGRTDTVAPADPATSTAARAALRAHPADRAALVTPAAPRAHRAAQGKEIRSVATSTGPRGATDPHLGDRAHHRGLSGAGRSRRPVGNG